MPRWIPASPPPSPVAGSVPIYLRPLTRSGGDYEQRVPAVYRIAEYLDLYLLGTFPGRLQHQLLLVRDDCCFSGRFSDAYVEIVRDRARALSARIYELKYDADTPRHALSGLHADNILEAASALTRIAFPPRPDLCMRFRDLKMPFHGVVQHEGHAYTAIAHGLASVADTAAGPRSPLILCEDFKRLGPPHSELADVKNLGGGRYRHFERDLFFSSSDGSSPLTNGRTYFAILPPE